MQDPIPCPRSILANYFFGGLPAIWRAPFVFFARCEERNGHGERMEISARRVVTLKPSYLLRKAMREA